MPGFFLFSFIHILYGVNKMKLFIITKQKIALFLALFVGTSFAFYGTARGISNTVSTEKKLVPIYCVETDEKKIAITFDAAWGAQDTDEIIAILEKYSAKATIFVVGDWVTKNPSAVKAFHGEGHEIANHSDTHAAFSKLDRAGIRAEIESCNKKIEEVTGAKCTLVRAPSGDYTNASIEVCNELNMPMIQWSNDSIDYKGLSVDDIFAKVTKNIKNGDILLFHNGVENTPAALEKILADLTGKGYKFVTVSELIYHENYKIDSTGKQILTGKSHTDNA